ncbi:MAG: hypothetical protein AAGD13_08445 [Pseudomonadota bacterium]
MSDDDVDGVRRASRRIVPAPSNSATLGRPIYLGATAGRCPGTESLIELEVGITNTHAAEGDIAPVTSESTSLFASNSSSGINL